MLVPDVLWKDRTYATFLHNEIYLLLLTVQRSICGKVPAGLWLLVTDYGQVEKYFNVFGEWATEYWHNTILDPINVYYFS